MRKLILFVTAAGLMLVMTADASAGIFGRRRCATQTYVYAPAPAATARADQGYRTYSYEPATSYQPVTPMYRSYQSPKMPPWAYQKTDPRRYQ
jgi:hypothetical protein